MTILQPSITISSANIGGVTLVAAANQAANLNGEFRFVDGSAPFSGIGGNSASTSRRFIASDVVGDTANRYYVQVDGSMVWGSGSAVADCSLLRSGTNAMTMNCSAGFTINGPFFMSSGNPILWNFDTGWSRTAAATIALGNGTQGDITGTLKLTNINFATAGQLMSSTVAFTNNAAAQTATLTNGPTAGNPTKWIPINDNGTIRNIPAW